MLIPECKVFYCKTEEDMVNVFAANFVAIFLLAINVMLV